MAGQRVAGAAIRVGVLTVSNPIYWGQREDECAPLVDDWVKTHLPGARVELVAMVQQRRNVVQGTLMVWADDVGLDLIFTLGGMEPAGQDVAVQAARAIVEPGEREVPGIAGLRGRTLVVNLPGERQAVQAALGRISPFLCDRWLPAQPAR
jgi:molybdopterin adenylyltransferase